MKNKVYLEGLKVGEGGWVTRKIKICETYKLELSSIRLSTPPPPGKKPQLGYFSDVPPWEKNSESGSRTLCSI